MSRFYLNILLYIFLNGFLLLGFAPVYGQAPKIIYPSPNVYTVGTRIAQLSPINTGGSVPAESYGISTFAGSTGTGGTFGFINGIKPDGTGSLFVTDGSQRLLRITPDGVLTVIAGKANQAGNINGQGAEARFNEPGQIAIDALGNIYVADQKNNLVRKITPGGLVATFAGSGVAGSTDGLGTGASFNQPTGLVFDGFGNLYVSDYNNDIIRKITPDGLVITIAGSNGTPGFVNGQGTSALFSGPGYMAIDGAGNLYVSDVGNNAIRMISPAGLVTTVAGSGRSGFQNGIGTAASFNHPSGIAIDPDGNLFVADQGNFSIRKITPTGIVSTYAGNGIQGATNGYPLTSIKLADPRDIIIDASGNLFVADGGQIRKINVSGFTIDKPLPLGLNFDNTTGNINGTPTLATATSNYTVNAYNNSGSSSFTFQITVNQTSVNLARPPQISYPDPGIYQRSKPIARLVPTNNGGPVPASLYGQVSTFAGNGAPGAADGTGKSASFNQPAGIAISPSGIFYVSDQANELVRLITAQGSVGTLAGKAGTSGFADGQGNAARFNKPTSIAVDVSGNIYVADALNNRIRKISPTGSVSNFAGNGAPGNTDGAALLAGFNHPAGLAFDAFNNLIVVDQLNNKIRKITSGGTVSTLAGNGLIGQTNGPALQASFNQPYGIAIDASGNIYVSEQNDIRKISTSGIVTTFAGSNVSGAADGTGTSASFNNPGGISLDISGNLYIADTGNDLIREISSQQQVTTIAGNVSGVGNNDKNFDQPIGIVIDPSGNAYITENWGGVNVPGNGSNLVTQLILSGYTINKPLPAGLNFDPLTGIISGTPTVLAPATDYIVTAYNSGGISSAKITITVEAATITPQKITFNTLADKFYGDNDFDPNAASSNNTIAINYSSSKPDVAIVQNGLIHITGCGTTQITAEQPGNDQFSAAIPVVQELIVNQAPLLVRANDLVKFQGQLNPELTFTATGFVYGETQAVLTDLPVLSTSAGTDSAPGDYPILVLSSGKAKNYHLSTANGTLTIRPSAIVVPNAFSPNGDGINDLWNIKALEQFPQCQVNVFGRNGSLVYQSRGYPKPWDGTYKGAPLPTGIYYYVIHASNDLPVLSGSVTILR